jgi:transposase
MSKKTKANVTQSKDKKVLELRQIRYFSEAFKRKIVADIESCKIKISEVASLYDVRQQSVYRWVRIYSKHLKNQTRMVVELDSESKKAIDLAARVAELERIIGQKQLSIDYLNKLIDAADEYYETDLKKNFVTPLSDGSINTKGNTLTN